MPRTYPGKRNPNYRHGGCGTRTYRIWKGMRARCASTTNAAWWRKYGARGIKVCKRWDLFANFLADMGEAPAGMCIDRRDNDRGYFPSNCRWVTPLQQARNTRQNVIYEIKGRRKCLSEWAEHMGTDPSSLLKRIKRGVVDAIRIN